MAEKVGVDPSAISRIEGGVRLPSLDAADALEKALELRKGRLASAVVTEKRKRRDRVLQLKPLTYGPGLSVAEIRRRLGENHKEQKK